MDGEWWNGGREGRESVCCVFCECDVRAGVSVGCGARVRVGCGARERVPEAGVRVRGVVAPLCGEGKQESAKRDRSLRSTGGFTEEQECKVPSHTTAPFPMPPCPASPATAAAATAAAGGTVDQIQKHGVGDGDGVAPSAAVAASPRPSPPPAAAPAPPFDDAGAKGVSGVAPNVAPPPPPSVDGNAGAGVADAANGAAAPVDAGDEQQVRVCSLLWDLPARSGLDRWWAMLWCEEWTRGASSAG